MAHRPAREVVGTKNTRIMRVPIEFDEFITKTDREFGQQMGFGRNKVATMRRLARTLDKKLVTKGSGFDWRIL